MRQANGLVWAKRHDQWPGIIPKPRPRRGSAKAAGLSYERALVGAIPGALGGVWWEFEDRNGHGWCQTDGILLGRNTVLVLEAKYSWVPEAEAKLQGLYLPVVMMATGLAALGIVVAKRLVPECRQAGVTIAHSLGEALDLARAGRAVCWHWLGNAPVRLAA